MKTTPEGFLICYNVPIARTGMQQYLGSEIGIADENGKLFKVTRTEEEVFSPATLASFEGKPVTNDHPSEDVAPDNYAYYSKGHATNIRRGEGKYSDTIMADLIICEKQAIEDVMNGKREISCGYECIYEITESGEIYQSNIRGNHIAIVDRGRAGPRVSIKDTQPKNERSRKYMKAKKRNNIIAKILGLTANDADPDTLADIIESVTELQNTDSEEETTETPKDSSPSPSANGEEKASDSNGVTIDSETATKLIDSINALNDSIASLFKKEDNDPLKALEDELSEEKVSAPVEEIDEESTADEDTTEDEEVQTDSEAISNNDGLLNVIRTIKPYINSIKDQKERKKVADSLTKAVRQIKGKSSMPVKDGYRAVMEAKAASAMDKVRKSESVDMDYQNQQSVYDKLNPHKGGK